MVSRRLGERSAIRIVAVVAILVAGWWLCWPDSDLTREFRTWAVELPLSERVGHEIGVRGLVVETAGGVRLFRVEFDGEPRNAVSRCDSVATFAKARGEDTRRIVITVHDRAGAVLVRKDEGAPGCR